MYYCHTANEQSVKDTIILELCVTISIFCMNRTVVTNNTFVQVIYSIFDVYSSSFTSTKIFEE